MGAIGSFLSGFSGNFMVALAIWPAISVFLTLPILVYLYHRDGRLKLMSAAAAYLGAFYLCGLVCFTLYPLPSGDSGPGITYGIEPQFNPLNFINDISRDGLKAVFQVLFNIILFVPLGFIAKRFLRLRLSATTILSLLVTCLIETAQLTGLFGIYPYAYRTFEVDDMIWNTLGGIVGWWCGHLFDKIVPSDDATELQKTNDPGFIRRCVALWVDSMIIGFCTIVPWLFCAVMSEFVFNTSFELFGLNAAQTGNVSLVVCATIAFVVVEVIVPWHYGGSTPGGGLVRMTFETVERKGSFRVLFYAVCTATLAVVFGIPQYAAPILMIFYLFARQMPYDYIPDGQTAKDDA